VGTLDGKVAVIIGSATGIGAATAKLMATEGARVAVADINRTGADAVASDIRAAGGDATAFTVDIADQAGVEKMINGAAAKYGGIDVLHNSAAALVPEVHGRDRATDALNLDLAVWDRTMAVNLRGYLLSCKYAVPFMLKRGRGSIINTTSTAGMRGLPVLGAYSVSKAGIIALTRHIARAYGKQGIRCNAVNPAAQPSSPASASETAQKYFSAESQARRLERLMTPRLGTYEDAANTIVFLASDRAEMITGQVITVDGGSSVNLAWP
jgi:NAD(P)-dependent dehydrogenase (short-subunit alcohol dehydrogenase family)